MAPAFVPGMIPSIKFPTFSPKVELSPHVQMFNPSMNFSPDLMSPNLFSGNSKSDGNEKSSMVSVNDPPSAPQPPAQPVGPLSEVGEEDDIPEEELSGKAKAKSKKLSGRSIPAGTHLSPPQGHQKRQKLVVQSATGSNPLNRSDVLLISRPQIRLQQTEMKTEKPSSSDALVGSSIAIVILLLGMIIFLVYKRARRGRRSGPIYLDLGASDPKQELDIELSIYRSGKLESEKAF